jgi:hypothetical protein
MALIRSDLMIFRIGTTGSDVPVLPTSGSGRAPIDSSLGRTSAEMPSQSPGHRVDVSISGPIEIGPKSS